MKRWMLQAGAVALGALAGFLYWDGWGCVDGCGITGQWWSSTAYGAVMGWLLLGLVLPAPKQGPGPAPQGPAEGGG